MSTNLEDYEYDPKNEGLVISHIEEIGKLLTTIDLLAEELSYYAL